MKSLALDLVEPGTDEQNRQADLRVSKTLPEGITSKMLYGDIVHIAWPSLVELTLTQLASMVDLMMVGQLGPWALTAVGLTTQPKFLLMTMIQALNVGATAMVARYKGADRQEKANEILRQALLLTFLIGMFFSVIGFIAAPWLISFMGAEEGQVMQGAIDYLRIQMIGLPGLALTAQCVLQLHAHLRQLRRAQAGGGRRLAGNHYRPVLRHGHGLYCRDERPPVHHPAPAGRL